MDTIISPIKDLSYYEKCTGVKILCEETVEMLFKSKWKLSINF